MLCYFIVFLLYSYCSPLDSHVLTHSFPPRRSFDLQLSPDLLSSRPHQLGDEAVQDLGGCVLSRLVVVSNRVSAAKQTWPGAEGGLSVAVRAALRDRKSTRLNSCH